MRRLPYDPVEFERICRESLTMAEAARRLGFHFNAFKSRAKKLGCYVPNQGGKGEVLTSPDELFVESSSYSTGHAKKIIRALKLKVYECAECGISEWNGKPLSLELDHINGRPRDHRLDNLRFLCPNCHSQTDSFRGRNINREKARHPVPDDVLLSALRSEPSIRAALMKVGLSPRGGNYFRCHRLLLGDVPGTTANLNQ